MLYIYYKLLVIRSSQCNRFSNNHIESQHSPTMCVWYRVSHRLILMRASLSLRTKPIWTWTERYDFKLTLYRAPPACKVLMMGGTNLENRLICNAKETGKVSGPRHSWFQFNSSPSSGERWIWKVRCCRLQLAIWIGTGLRLGNSYLWRCAMCM